MPPGVTVGVDVGGTKCLGVALDASGRVVAEVRVPTPTGADHVLDTVAALARQLHGGPTPASGIGIGVPGLVDRAGVLRFAPNLPGVVDVDVRAGVAARLGGAEVRVENDATCAGWAESRVGAAAGRDHVVLVTLGTGIGGGLVGEGQMYRGAWGFAGEVGHMVVDPHGPPCPCGQRGCWERFASGSALGRLGADAAREGDAAQLLDAAGGDPGAITGHQVTAAATAGDPDALAIVDTFAWWVALGLANLANVLDPELFVIGGGVVAAGEVVLAPVRSAFAALVAATRHRPQVAIVPAHLGERAGAIGAALLFQ